jgi:hypothetical protein
LLIALYNTFRIEVGNYFHNQIVKTAVEISPGTVFENAVYRRDNDLNLLNVIWQINYSMLFLTGLSVLNIKKIKSDVFGYINLLLNALLLLIFVTAGLYILGD